MELPLSQRAGDIGIWRIAKRAVRPHAIPVRRPFCEPTVGEGRGGSRQHGHLSEVRAAGSRAALDLDLGLVGRPIRPLQAD